MKKTITSEQYKNLIDWLHDGRQALGWSMRDLAEKLGRPHSFVQRVEMLERRLDVHEYVIYCRALDLDPADGLVFFD